MEPRKKQKKQEGRASTPDGSGKGSGDPPRLTPEEQEVLTRDPALARALNRKDEQGRPVEMLDGVRARLEREAETEGLSPEV